MASLRGVILLIISIFTATGQIFSCVPNCTCDFSDSSTLVICSVFPTDLPSNVTSLKTNASERLTLLDVQMIQDNSTALSALDISQTNLSFIEPEVLRVFPSLEIVVLSSNKLARVTNETFRGCENVTEIYLDDNVIEQLEPGSFVHLEHLLILDLSHNKIKYLPPLPPMLGKLNLFSNHLETIDDTSFNYTKNLTILNLCENPLQQANFLGHLTHTLYSDLTSLCTPALPKDANLKYYHLKQLELIRPSDFERGMIKSDTLSQFVNAVENNFKHLHIENYHIESGNFINAPALQTLSLRNVTLEPGQDDAFVQSLLNLTLVEQIELNESPQLMKAIIQSASQWKTLQHLHVFNITLDVDQDIFDCALWLSMLKHSHFSLEGNMNSAYCLNNGEKTDIARYRATLKKSTKKVKVAKTYQTTTPDNLTYGPEKDNTAIWVFMVGGMIVAVVFASGFFYFRRRGSQPDEFNENVRLSPRT